MVPFFIFYSMFGFQRVGDLIWAAADARAKGFLLGATAGRTTLLGEGLQHQDGHSLVLASTVPTCQAYDPAFAYETGRHHPSTASTACTAGTERHGATDARRDGLLLPHPLQRELRDAGPARRTSTDDDIVGGLYRWAPAPEGSRPTATILFSGSRTGRPGQAAGGARRAARRRRRAVERHVATRRLREDALSTERWNRLHPAEAPRTAPVTDAARRARRARSSPSPTS